MKIIMASPFARVLKKLQSSQRHALDQEITKLIKNPCLGKPQQSELKDVLVHEFKTKKQETFLLAYTYETKQACITLLMLGQIIEPEPLEPLL